MVKEKEPKPLAWQQPHRGISPGQAMRIGASIGEVKMVPCNDTVMVRNLVNGGVPLMGRRESGTELFMFGHEFTIQFEDYPNLFVQTCLSADAGIESVGRNLKAEFNERADRWRKETSFQSSLVAKIMHDDYQAIMTMGTPAIPWILERLKKAPEHWFWALKFLAKKDVAEGAESPSAAARAWLQWGKDKDHIS